MKLIDISLNSLTPEDFKKFKIVDIREAEELTNDPAHIKSAHVPLSQFPANITAFNKNDDYLIFCAMGGRSHHLAAILQNQGYKTYSVNHGVHAINAYVEEYGIA